MSRLFLIGKIVNTQGIKGEVRITPFTFDIKRFDLLDEVILKKEKFEDKIISIEKVRYHKQFVIIKFKNIDDMNTAETLKNYEIFITEDKAIPLEENEYYHVDLYDMEVYAEDNEFLGTIQKIIETGANDVYVIQKEGEKDLLIPAIRQCVLNVDVENKKMLIHLMEGLR